VTDRYAVMGNPIGHSKSPQIHTLFATQTGQDLTYKAILAPLDGFTDAVNSFRNEVGKGLNITVPFKQEAWQIATERSERAERAGAVNTLTIKDDNLIGDNTDGVGLVRDLTINHQISIKDKRVLLLGAGGASRGVISPLIEQVPINITIANRTVSKAHELVALFGDLGKVHGCGFSELTGENFDIIINATAAGLEGKVPELPKDIINKSTVCYDMMYSNKPTAFVRYAQQSGAEKTFDGLGMLIEQAAESFYIWRGVQPETSDVIQTLRK
jgi:shikimate dehydrogenase